MNKIYSLEVSVEEGCNGLAEQMNGVLEREQQ